MKPRIYLIAAAAIVAVGSLPFLAGAQPVTPEGRKSDEIVGKMHKMDMVNQLLPVLMTTTQIKSVLPKIELARKAEKDLMAKEAAMLKKIEPLTDKAIKEALEKRKVVPQETMKQCSDTTKAMLIARQMLSTEHVDAVTKAVESTLDAGQIRAAANSVSMSVYFPGKKLDEVPESTRLRTWVKYVLMDYQSYDLLIALSRRSD